MAMVGVANGSLHAGGLTAQVDWLGLAPNHIHQMNRVNSRNDFKS